MRKSPVHHRVKQHTRKSRTVHSYERGHGKKKTTQKRRHNPHTKKVRIKKNNLHSTKQESKPFDFWNAKPLETKPFDFWSEEKPIPQELELKKPEKPVQKDIPLYTRDELERIFLDDTEEQARETAEKLGFEFEGKDEKPELGVKILDYRYPIDTDIEPGIQEPDTYRLVDLTVDLDTGKVKEVFSSMGNR